jgi:hypothetical protein
MRLQAEGGDILERREGVVKDGGKFGEFQREGIYSLPIAC